MFSNFQLLPFCQSGPRFLRNLFSDTLRLFSTRVKEAFYIHTKQRAKLHIIVILSFVNKTNVIESAQAVTLLPFIGMVPYSNPGRDTDCSDRRFCSSG
jgi:predicted AlkP superfamily pyrophosphatase or phosphodiesterase